ncbi:helix-turn-helix domain-containing protein [Allostreptomyces psammosilenae]|uniref:DNA-binding transcriptional MerR regulator n=1 Tax=Allostreptomyces psammosilenae TaxID=1892865 RepID=A0A852ZPW8_9ACTN|nr:MerR family transcriptional regulator [Allostreptomyces psammosilenae]NYI03537.1 DNA-binding transcriptional MerR regulator [Allostreptomyces psammosilenae]
MKSSEADGPLAIGALAARFGLPTHVLRHWESMGLLEPERDHAGRRRYGRPDVVRVAAVLRAKEAGLSLESIRQLLATADVDARRRVMARHRDDLRQRMERIRAALEMLDCAMGCRHADLATCPHFRRAVAEPAREPVGEPFGASSTEPFPALFTEPFGEPFPERLGEPGGDTHGESSGGRPEG